jgi:hypothetical protein
MVKNPFSVKQETLEERILLNLANDFYASNYNIKKLMKQIFLSDWFYNESNVGNQIKSPIHFIANMMKHLNMKFTDPKALDYLQKSLGQILIKPPNVAGWPGGRAWIDNSTLMLRLNLAYHLINNSEIDLQVKNEAEAEMATQKIKKLQSQINLGPFKKRLKEISRDDWPTYLAELLLIKPIDIKEKLIASNASKDDLHLQWLLIQICSLPEYQLA